VSEILTFHFDGELASSHRMNFYEAARFQYAAARLLVKLAQFREFGRFGQRITSSSNYDIEIKTHTKGSFNINVEDKTPQKTSNNSSEKSKTLEPFIDVPLSSLFSYVADRLLSKSDESAEDEEGAKVNKSLSVNEEKILNNVLSGTLNIEETPVEIRDIIRKHISEINRKNLDTHTKIFSKIDDIKSQKLVAMSAPLFKEMATPLRTSASTLEVQSTRRGKKTSLVFIDKKIADEIENEKIDKLPTNISGNIKQLNKDNGYGKIQIENGLKTIGFNVPYDLLPKLKMILIQGLAENMVDIKAFLVRDQADEVIKAIIIDINIPKNIQQ